mmetsp:Transcript_36356/g.112488  ORF Transcript_36356/g.112488 Transcript_36356/m.112488 type:complete len:208 (+) Transcript_36356:102-725(+)
MSLRTSALQRLAARRKLVLHLRARHPPSRRVAAASLTTTSRELDAQRHRCCCSRSALTGVLSQSSHQPDDALHPHCRGGRALLRRLRQHADDAARARAPPRRKPRRAPQRSSQGGLVVRGPVDGPWRRRQGHGRGQGVRRVDQDEGRHDGRRHRRHRRQLRVHRRRVLRGQGAKRRGHEREVVEDPGLRLPDQDGHGDGAQVLRVRV